MLAYDGQSFVSYGAKRKAPEISAHPTEQGKKKTKNRGKYFYWISQKNHFNLRGTCLKDVTCHMLALDHCMVFKPKEYLNIGKMGKLQKKRIAPIHDRFGGGTRRAREKKPQEGKDRTDALKIQHFFGRHL